MPYIVLDDEQAGVFLQTHGPIELRDRRGRCLGYVDHGFTEEDIQEAKRILASDEPRYTTAEVLQHLRSLETQ